MYKSPIEETVGEMQIKMIKKEEEVLCQVEQAIGYHVDKDELIKALQYDRDQYEKGYQDAKEEIMRWISCSERLPDNDDAVLISHSHGVTKAWWNGRFWTSIAVKKYKTVTAWMPLPEPYKPKEEA